TRRRRTTPRSRASARRTTSASTTCVAATSRWASTTASDPPAAAGHPVWPAVLPCSRGVTVSFHRRAVFPLLLAVATAVSLPPAVHAQSGYFFPQTTDAAAFDTAIPTPEQFLGYPIGSR